MLPPRLKTPFQWLSAPACVALSSFATLVLLPKPEVAPFVLFWPGVAASAWLAGRRAGLLAVVLSALVANYFFVDVPLGWSVDPPALWATALYIAGSTVIALICASLREALFDAQRAAETQRRQADLMELSHDAIVVWHMGGRIESWNRGAEELYGHSVGEALGRNVHELLATSFPRPLDAIKAVLRKDRRWQGTLRHTTKQGHTLWVATRLLLVPGNDGGDRVLETNRDITERVEAEERKDQFLALLSHELRNPLAPIRNSLYLIHRAPPGSEAARRALDVVDRQVAHLTRLVEDLLDVSRISRGKVQIRRQPVDFAAVVVRALDDTEAAFAGAGIAVERHGPRNSIWVQGDEDRLAQVVSNLLVNASKFTPREGRVHVALTVEHATAVLRVGDTGVGISPELMPSLFVPFVQGQQALDRRTGGLGLGLALVKNLVERHGGTVEVKSDGVGLGAEFTVRLPVEAAPISAVAPICARAAKTGRRVLIIEDNVDAADSLRDALELDGHEVEVALDGAEGLEKARASVPDVVLCDIGLPGMDGYEVARAVRADAALHEVTLIALTGYALSEDLRKAREAGFDLHLAKPADIDELQHTVATAPSRRVA